MEEPQAVETCIIKVENEVKQEVNNEDLDSSRMEEASSSAQVMASNIKVEDASDEELERPAQVMVEDFKEDMQEGYYASILPAGSSVQTSVSVPRQQTSLQLQWKNQDGQPVLPSQMGSSEHQWVDEKGVLTISAPSVGAQWIPADAQNFTDRDGTIVKDGSNVQYVLMTSADSFYLVESGDANALCASDGSIKNIVSGDKNIQMISLVPNQNITNSGVVIGNIAEPEVIVDQPLGEPESVIAPTGSSNKRNNEPVVLSTIAPEDCDLRQTEPTRKRKKTDKLNTSLPEVRVTEDEGRGGIKKPCDLNTCPLRCTAVFDDDERSEIYRAFQSLSPDDQKKFVMQCCSRKIFLKDLKTYDGSTKSTSHFKYDFQLRSAKGVPVQVCKLFFASTLGFSEFYFSCYLTDLYKTPSGGGKFSPSSTSSQCTCSGVTNSRSRGKATGKWAANCKIHSDVYSHIHRELFHKHIESFLRTLCIQQGEHTRTIRYLPKDITIQMMHEDFVLKHPEVICSYELYKNFVVLFTS